MNEFMTRRPINISESAMAHRGDIWRPIGIVIFCVATTLALDLIKVTAAQRRTQRRPVPAARAAIDYSKFSHTTEKHRGECLTCHKVPTKNWQRVGDYPDVADYPDHDACVSCHRRQFFRGARPQICTVCHLQSSPREDKRYVFRNPASSLQFAIEFPHDKHQDVIARSEPPPRFRGDGGSVFFQRASFSPYEPAVDEPGKLYNNCTICHEPLKTAPPAPSNGWLDSFAPDAATFKAVPLKHASCFNCHWKSQAPVRNDCGGCHKAAAPYASVSTITRISMKFRHAREQHVHECTSCHINITKSATLRGLTPDVPITSCTECHNKQGLRLDVANELEAIDRNRGFVCVYCHTSDVGRRDPPASHYLISGREPLQRRDVK